MTYREVYKMAKNASLDKKALMPLSKLLKKYPQIVGKIAQLDGGDKLAGKAKLIADSVYRKMPTLAKRLRQLDRPTAKHSVINFLVLAHSLFGRSKEVSRMSNRLGIALLDNNGLARRIEDAKAMRNVLNSTRSTPKNIFGIDMNSKAPITTTRFDITSQPDVLFPEADPQYSLPVKSIMKRFRDAGVRS